MCKVLLTLCWLTFFSRCLRNETDPSEEDVHAALAEHEDGEVSYSCDPAKQIIKLVRDMWFKLLSAVGGR